MLRQLFWCLLTSALVTQVAVFSTTIFLHRSATHKALELHPAVAFVFRLCLWITTGLCTREWVAVHRKHHAFTEVEGDPHSPHLHGFWSVQLGNVFHYLKEAKNPETLERYARDIEDDVFDRVAFRFGFVGPLLGIVGALLCAGLLVGTARGGRSPGHVCLRAVVVDQRAVPLHRLQELRQHGDQHPIRRLLTGGEGLHNNHHGHPRSPKFSCAPQRDRSRRGR